MDDLQSKISEILSDPEALNQVKSLGAMLGLGDNSQPVQNVLSQPENNTGFGKNNAKANDDVSSLLGNITPDTIGMISKIAPMLKNINKEDDTTRLLNAIYPFLSEVKRGKIEQAKKFLQLFRLLPLLKDGGLF